MPRYKIETMAQVRRVYIVEADNATDAENVLVNDEEVGKYLDLEEDISEEVDDVSEVPSEDAA